MSMASLKRHHARKRFPALSVNSSTMPLYRCRAIYMRAVPTLYEATIAGVAATSPQIAGDQALVKVLTIPCRLL